MPEINSTTVPERRGRQPTRETHGGLAAIATATLGRVADGRLTSLPLAVAFWDGTTTGLSPHSPIATLAVKGPAAVARLLRHPTSLGLAEAWIAGDLELDGDLLTVLALGSQLDGVRLSWRDRARLTAGAARIGARALAELPRSPPVKAHPAGRKHSQRRDRAAVRHHYDVSNRFYELFLGPSMSYSCGVFSCREESLEVAQERKHELICRRLELREGERLLDVGCGWGSLLLHAVRRYRVRGVGVTLSERQAQLARERVRGQGLSDQVEIRIADYRETDDGPYDKIASVGMYEHVGADHYLRYLQKLHSLLRPGGRLVNDGVARLFSSPPCGETFISRYVFPDGEIHPLSSPLSNANLAGLEVLEVHALREDYALTLKRWYANLQRRRVAAVREVGEQRVRVWELYLAACVHAFRRGDQTNHHVVFQRPR